MRRWGKNRRDRRPNLEREGKAKQEFRLPSYDEKREGETAGRAIEEKEFFYCTGVRCEATGRDRVITPNVHG